MFFFSLKNIRFTTGRAHIAAGSNFRHSHGDQHDPAIPVPSQTKSEAPWGAYGEKVTDHAEPAEHKQHHPPCLKLHLVELPLVQFWTFPGRSLPVGVYYCHPRTVWPNAHPNENVWRHLSHMKSIILTGLESTHPYLFQAVFFPEFDMLILIISDVLQGSSLNYNNLAQTHGSKTSSMAQYPQV